MPSEISNAGSTDQQGGYQERAPVSLVSMIVLGWMVAAILIMTMAYMVDHWDVLAVTRLLNPLISAHIIQYVDMEYAGWIVGLPRASLWFDAQQPVDWWLILMSILLFMAYSLLKALQFRRLALIYEVPGTFGQHVRAWLYGDGIDRFMPFHTGLLATGMMVGNDRAEFQRAHTAAALTHSFVYFKFAVFSIVGLLWVGWSLWLSEVLWAIGIVVVAYFILRPRGEQTANSVGAMSVMAAISGFRGLASRAPMELVKLCLLSILAFMVFEMAFYLALESLTTVEQDFAPPMQYIFLSILGGYLARAIPVTPGAVGQFELGCAAGFWIAGGDISLALFVGALVANFFRILSGLALMAVVVMRYEIPTSLRQVMNIYRGAEPLPD